MTASTPKGNPVPPKAAPASLPAVIKRARDIMRKDAGLNGDADRIPQFAWLLFLKALDDLDDARAAIDQHHRPVLDAPYRWQDWAADPTRRRSGDPLTTWVNGSLLPHLAKLTGSGKAGDERETVASVFKETRNRMLSGYLLADLVDQVDKVSFASPDDVHTMAHLYESMLREMRDAAGDAGEFYTPRPLIRFMVGRVDPRPGETVMDPAVGTGGFLVEAWDHLVQAAKAAPSPAREREKLRGSLRGFEKKPMPHLLGQMNLLLHEVDQPKITRTNALAFTQAEQRRDGVDVVLTNPPFGGEEEAGIKENVKTEFRTAETAWLFLVSVMERVRRSPNGRAAIVVPNKVLFDQGVGAVIKRELLRDFNLHTVMRLPEGVFEPYTGIPANVLFFERGGPTREIWFYEHPLPDGRKKYTKTKPLRYEEFDECERWWGGSARSSRTTTHHAWRVSVDDVGNGDLDIQNPQKPDDLAHRRPVELVNALHSHHLELADYLQGLRGNLLAARRDVAEILIDAPTVRVGDVLLARRESVSIDAAASYRTIGVRSFAKGLIFYPEVAAPQLGKLRFFKLPPAALIISNIKAWEGAVALSPAEDEGIIMSNRFLAYVAKEDSIDLEFAWQFFASDAGVSALAKASPGSADRNRTLGIRAFGSLKMPLPSIQVQKEVVSMLRAFAGAEDVSARLATVSVALPRAARNEFFSDPRRNGHAGPHDAPATMR